MQETEVLDSAELAEQQSETVKTEVGATDTPETVETDEQKTERAKEEEARSNRKKEEKRQTSFQKRIDELTTDKYEERKRADELMKQNQRLLELYGHKNGAATPQSGEPTREQFENYEDFVTARAMYQADAKVTAALEKFTTTQQATQAKTAQETDRAAVEKQFLERRAEVEKRIPDYREVIEDWEPKLPDAVVDTIMRLPEGPLLSYHFAKTPELEAKVRNAPAYMQGIVLGEILATLKSSTKGTSAPAPGKPVSGKNAPSSDGHYSGPPEGYMAWATKHLK